MKKFWIIVSIMAILGGSVMGAVVKNPSEPDNPRHGRVVTLKEINRIADTGEDFFFMSPNTLKIDADGSIYVIDNKEFLVFNPKGGFVRNLYKYGLGPSEVTFLTDYQLLKNEIILFNELPNKIIWFDKSGNFLKEKRINCNQNLDFLFFSGKKFIFKSRTPPIIKTDLSIIETLEKFLSISLDGELLNDKIYSFTSNVLIGRFGSTDYAQVNASSFHWCESDDESFYFANTPEYEIKLFDTVTESIPLTITRSYKRVKTTRDNEKFLRQGGIMKDGKMHYPPVPKYFDDILRILKHKNELWVVTSTVAPGKGILIDVFDSKGKYRDCFYLKLPGHIAPYYLVKAEYYVLDDLFFLIESDKEYNYSIAIYKMGL
jgi:hypothetical protein